MSKITALIAGMVIIIGGAAAFMLLQANNKESAKVINTNNGQSQTVKIGKNVLVAVDACDVLTEAVAKQILGDGASKSDTSAGNASSDAVSVSNCIYTVKIDPNASKPNNTKGVSVLARAAKTQEGADSNQSQFGSNKPSGTQAVSGVGDKAFFNPQFGQLNVLKGSNWYIVSNYTGSPLTATVATDKQLADLLHFK